MIWQNILWWERSEELLTNISWGQTFLSESELHEIIVEIVINVEIKILSNFGVLQTSDSSIINRITFLFTQIVIRFKVRDSSCVVVVRDLIKRFLPLFFYSYDETYFYNTNIVRCVYAFLREITKSVLTIMTLAWRWKVLTNVYT